MSKDVLKSLGIHVGEAPSLLNQKKADLQVSKGDLGEHVVRSGTRGNARDALDAQLGKGMAFGCSMPKMELKRVSPHAEEREIGLEDERQKDEEKADEKFRKKPRPQAETDGLKDTNAESFHSDNDKQVKDIQETVEEIDREFPRESRPAKKRGEWDYNRTEDGEKRYIYDMKSDSANALDFEGEMFLKAMGESCGTPKKMKADAPPPPPPPSIGNTATSGGTSTVNAKIGFPFGKAKKKSLIQYTEDSNDPDLIANVHENYEGVNEKLRPGELIMRSKAFDKIKKKGALVDWAKEEEAEEEHKPAKKSDELDELASLVKSAPVVAAKPTARRAQAPKSNVQFVKSAGVGGIQFDFGHRTGNPIADRTTDLLNSFADPVQAATAEYHRKSFDDAVTGYTKQGDGYSKEATPFGNVEKGWGDQLNKPMDQQVQEAFDAGQFDKGGPAVKNEFNSVQANLNGEVLKATSETDAAVLEMFKAEQEAMRSTEGGFVADASTGGKISVTAGE